MKLIKDTLCKTRNISHDHRNLLYLGSIILFGAVLRFYDLGVESFWFDEIYTVNLISQDMQILLNQLATRGNVTRNAVYYILAYFWVLPTGINEISIRSLSVVFGILSIGMIYLVGRQLFGVRVGLISSFLMAVSGFQIQHSQAARSYSLFVLLTLISIYFYIRVFKTGNTWLWILNSLINVLLFYTHTYAIFVFVTEYLHYLFYWKRHQNNIGHWAFSQILLFLAIIPGFIPVIRGGKLAAGLGSSLAWIPPPSIKDLLRIVYDYLLPQNYQHSWLFIIATFVAALTFFMLSAMIYDFQRKNYRSLATLFGQVRKNRFLTYKSSEFTLVSLWFVCPTILPFIYSNLFPPVFQDRYTICAAPAFYLLIAVLISQVRRLVPVYISIFALMIVILPGLQDYYVADINEQWREVAAFVGENVQSKDIVIYAPDEEGTQHKSFDWYYRGNIPGCGFSSKITDEHIMADILSNCTLGYDRFWVIIRGTVPVVNRMKSFFLSPNQATLRLLKDKQFVGILVYLFELEK